MKSPLALDKANIKEYKVPTIVELHVRQKLAFLQDQKSQLMSMHYRSRIDMLHAKRLQEEKNEVLREKGLSNMATHRNEMQQSIGAIEMISALIDEIKAESGEEAGTHPDGY